MMNRITQSWSIARILRLVIGLAAAAQGVYSGDIPMVLAGSFLFTMSVFNYGCCGSGGCATNFTGKSQTELKDLNVEYEELDKGK